MAEYEIFKDENGKEYHIETHKFIRVKIGVKPGFILRKVGEAYMVMPTGPRMKEYKGMITLNETGADLFKASQAENPSKRSLMDALIAKYGVDEKEAEEAVDSFVQQCARAGLFEMESNETQIRVYETESKTENEKGEKE